MFLPSLLLDTMSSTPASTECTALSSGLLSNPFFTCVNVLSEIELVFVIPMHNIVVGSQQSVCRVSCS